MAISAAGARSLATAGCAAAGVAGSPSSRFWTTLVVSVAAAGSPFRPSSRPAAPTRVGDRTSQGGPAMGDKGSKDKGKREQQKAAQHTAKEKRRIKQAKKGKGAAEPEGPAGK